MNKEKQLKLIKEAEDKLKDLKESYKNTGWKPNGSISYDSSGGLSHNHSDLNWINAIPSRYLVSARKAMKRAFWEYSLALELNEGWKPDWKDGDIKYTVNGDYTEVSGFIEYNQGVTLTFKTKELAEKAIKIMKNWELDKEDVS